MWTYLKAVSSGVWEFVLPYIKELLTESGRILMEVALDVVKQVAVNNANLPGTEKKAIAFDSILAQLQSKGIDVAARKINKAIENALDKVDPK